MRLVALALIVTCASPLSAQVTFSSTDSYVMGAGGWTCAKVLETFHGTDESLKGQLAGWVLGVWTRATTEREKGFTDIVENVGGLKIYEATLNECRQAPPSTYLYRVAYKMIENTNPQK
ncbi:hypothetical protein [Sagittula stellata]|uniref:5'-methylthioadenosine phosphorylase n=1 Tax=Sagittula stellata (strain ATCC 700073 / DSM 11524 / E-37) TaxID=388399 RepID=A3K059_SAGS3|nr:hypothetical protein [Sagittula stellata]EBA09174.1 5'-methylthioadenosine phosphorylase [Sagittula stellata E-37]